MKIIISPAKKINHHIEFSPQSSPKLFSRTQEIYDTLITLDYPTLKELWNCSDKIAQTSYEKLHEKTPTAAYLPALLAYNGIQYQYMAPQVFHDQEWTYVQEHLRILSGFYGILRPLDAIIPYRLEMQALLTIGNHSNLYDYWNQLLHDELYQNNDLVINLASKEYSQCIRPYVNSTEKMVDIHFVVLQDNKIRTKATYAKMARGAMVRFMAEKQVTSQKELQAFQEFGYQFDPSLSTEKELYFVSKQ